MSALSDPTLHTESEVQDLNKQLSEALIRFELVNRSASEGLWDMAYPSDGAVGP